MWLWLQRKLPKPTRLVGRLLLFTLVVHLFVLFTIFFVYRGDTIHHFQLHARALCADTPVIFMPLFKHIVHKNGVPAQSTKKTMDCVNTLPSKKTSPTTVTKTERATTLVTQVPRREKKKKKEVVAKKEKANVKKIVTQEKKIEPNKAVADQVKEEPKMDLSTTNTSAQQEQSVDNAHYVGRDDLDALQMQEYISSEIQMLWKPPRGIAKDKICELCITINWQGLLHALKVHKTSGILIYDASAKEAVMAMKFPKWMWGKDITITFKQ